MILHPETDAETIAAIAAVTADARLSLDTRAMLARLIAECELRYCPTKTTMAKFLREGDRALGRERINRMVNEALAAGYMARAIGKIPRRRQSPLYSFIVGSPAAVAAFVQNAGDQRARVEIGAIDAAAARENR